MSSTTSSSAPASPSDANYSLPATRYSLLLIAYFRSGWAFLLPYLAAYLLYAWLRWPVNPAVAGAGSEGPMAWSWVPCLLHVYWGLHVIHLVLGVTALRTWWKSSIPNLQLPTSTGASSAIRSTGDRLLSTGYSLLPWLCLALIFWIPGLYLEWPSDHWEHLRRINEWRILDEVTAHSAWKKSSYFLPYSLFSWADGLHQLRWLDLYYTGLCLLLSWQYYRMALACGLSSGASLVFVILQALLLGNSTFSFYRYYGISSSIFSQLGAVALIRLLLQAANERSVLLDSAAPQERFAPKYIDQNTISDASPGKICTMLLTGSLLLAFIALNHQQGLGIAALGCGAVVVWRLGAWKYSILWWLLILTLAANVLFIWSYPRPPAIETYRATGFLNIWYGFNLLDLRSPAGDRMLQIVSAFGLINLAAALVLLRRNHLIGWLTILPFAAMLSPIVSVPLTQALVHHGNNANYIITFQRMFFSIPPCLALVCLATQLSQKAKGAKFSYLPARNSCPEFAVLCLTLVALVATPSSSPAYNRTWHSSVIVPGDLRLLDVFSEYEAIRPQLLNRPESKVVATQLGTALLSSYSAHMVGPSPVRLIASPATDSAIRAVDFLARGAMITAHPCAASVAAQPGAFNTFGIQNLLMDPQARNPASWIALAGHAPEFVSDIAGPSTSTTALQNPTGATSNTFTRQMIPIKHFSSYRVGMTVRQFGDGNAINYLAIAWYDGERNILYSNVNYPQGAGHPRGWSNGAYSYFGLVAQAASADWTTHEISFGLNEIATIPPNAHFIRVGALLNSNAVPAATLQLTNITLREKAVAALGLALPQGTSAYSIASQAAQLSRHWPPQQVLVDRVGTKEIEAASESALKPVSGAPLEQPIPQVVYPRENH